MQSSRPEPAAGQERRPRIRILATGGTIANRTDGRIGIDAVLEDIRTWYPDSDPAAIADLDVVDVLREGAETFTPAEWLTVAQMAARAADDPEVDGIVVTHGTYTAEETAYFLHLTVQPPSRSWWPVRSGSTRPSATMGTRTCSTLCGSLPHPTPAARAHWSSSTRRFRVLVR